MANSVSVLCYHRILTDDLRGRNPYFLRGTAVSKTVFRRHIREVGERFECLDEARALAVLQGEEELPRPGCWITFDDSYVDVVDTAAPLLEEAGMRASLFVSTAVLNGTTLPADRWYATLGAARRRRGRLPGSEPWKFDLDEPSSLDRFIDGPEKRLFLRSTPEEQEDLLRRLAVALDAGACEPKERIYLSGAEVRDLARRGWSVGSHTVAHPILVGLGGEKQRQELDASRSRLAELVGIPPRTFAYPDGAWDEATAARVQQAGYSGAVTLLPDVARPGGNIFAIPRILARNDPHFVDSLLTFADGP